MSTDITIITAPAIPTLNWYSLNDVDTIASIIHGEAWASLHEECGGNLGQCEITEVMPAPPSQAVTLALWVLVQAEAAGDRPDTTPAADIGFHVIGSGGGSGAPVKLDLDFSYHYYLGDDAQVYLWCEKRPFGDEINNECMGDCRGFDIPEQVQIICTVTYDITDPDAADMDNDGVIERGFIVGNNDLPCGEEGGVPLVGAAARKWQQENEVASLLLLPSDAEELRELARGRSVTGPVELEADSVQDQHTGEWRHETLHIRAAESKTTLSAAQERAIIAAVRKALRIR